MLSRKVWPPLRLSGSFFVPTDVPMKLTSAYAPVVSGAIARVELFLLKLLRPLVRAGILHSRRAPGGGYRLTRDPKDITLLEIVEAVERPLRGVAPSLGNEGAQLDMQLQSVCDAIAAQVRERLATVTLAGLAGR